MRRTWINVHLYIAAFFAVVVLLMATSGGLYLLDVRGTVDKTPVALADGAPLDLQSETLEADVRALLAASGIEHDFEYLRLGSAGFVTRPTSRTYYEFSLDGAAPAATRNEPSLIAAIIELHKGHGPGLFRTLQKALAVGLLVMVASGVVTGLMAPAFRTPTLGALAAGVAVFLIAVLA